MKDELLKIKSINDNEFFESNQVYSNNSDEKEEIDDKDLDLELKHGRKSVESVKETHLESTLLYQEPAYAEICSFFNIFSSLLNMKPISFKKLEKIFCTFYNGEGYYYFNFNYFIKKNFSR